jgi:hypothetical protein
MRELLRSVCEDSNEPVRESVESLGSSQGCVQFLVRDVPNDRHLVLLDCDS